MVCFKDFMAKAPVTALPEMPREGILFEGEGPVKASDASTRSGSPSASSMTSEHECSHGSKKGQAKSSGLTWEALEKELLKVAPQPLPPAPTSPMKSKACILGSCPSHRMRPSSIALPSDASERTPMATPAVNSWSNGGILGTPAARPPLPRFDASQRTPNGFSIQSDISFMSSAMSTSPTKRRHAVPMADASQRSTGTPSLRPTKNFLSTTGTRSPASGDASQRMTPATASTPVSQQASSPATPASPLSTSPTPSSPASTAAAAAAAEAHAAATAAAAKAAAEAAAQAAAAAAAAAETAAKAAVMASAVTGDASQRHLQPVSPAANEQPTPAKTCTLVACDASGRQLFGKELEAELRAAAPAVYED
eukprot:TRINITY_DN995_c0_g1_i8.p1 TRINITY_DN995_c0_g1~~TRINITY_DN995_c0_g1_i8.p1  ORF type:complete len:367 (-),score=103.97 TRINITY_DN995_c0_g1_i8:233-1333(-)